MADSRWRLRAINFRIFVALLAVLLLAAGFPSTVSAATFTVTKLADTDDGACNADCSLREAIAAAASGDTVTFAPGLTGAIILLGQSVGGISIFKNLTIQGPGASQLSIGGGGIGSGAIYNGGGSLTISGITFSGNSARTWCAGTSGCFGGLGGAIRNVGSLTLINVTFSGNSAAGGGGAIYNQGSLTVTNSTFSGNSAGQGSAILSFNGSLSVTNSTFSGNSTPGGGSGGAITNAESIVSVTNSTFNGNSSTSGGAINNSSGGLTVTNSTFSSNSASSGGGAIVNNSSGSLTVTNSTFSGNSATFGGAIENNGSATVINSTFSGNSGIAYLVGYTPRGGAIENEGSLTITNSTLSGNSAHYGGAILKSHGDLSVGNTVIAGNTAVIQGPDIFGHINSRGHNLLGNGADASGLTNGVNGDQVGSNPLLGPLANNGGPTATHALLPGSPAIDAGDNAMCAAAVGSPTYGAGGLDQRGMARPQGARCDIGAFELPPSDVTPPEITPTVTGTLGNNGWYTSNVSVSWSVTDPDSAISASSGCGSNTVSSDTAGTTFTCTATSAGGPASNSVTVKRDATPPTISGSSLPAPNANGWNNTPVTVSFACADNLSGVATCASDITLSADGASQSVTGNTATDLAGNTASTTVSNIHIDKTKPTITASRTPANAADWNNGDVTVTFTCSDPVSGLAGPCPTPETVTTEGAGQSRSGTVADLAGNSGSITVSGINIDKTAPTITGSRSPAANAAGWNNADVTVSFTCADTGSGVDSCGPTPQTVTTQGAGQSRTGTVADLAGNTASTSVGNIHIDKTAPLIVIITPTLDSLIASSPVTVQVQAADAVGVASLSVNGVPALLAGGTPQAGTWQATVSVTLPVPVGGALSFTVTAGDPAGNVTLVTTVVDNDGIDAAIDTQPLANSNDFSDVSTGGTTSGTITNRGGWTVNVKDVSPGGVEAVVTGTGTTATLSTCAAGGAERVELDGAGETASVECLTTTGLNTGSKVTAITATSPTGNPKILVRDASGKVQARLSTTQSMTIGSPVTAGATNIGSMLVELLDDEGVVFASFSLDAAESVDVTFTTGANNVNVVELTVLVGPVDFTIGTRTVTLTDGQAGTFPTDVTPPTIGSAAVTPTVLWPANHKMVDVAVRYQATDDRDPAPTCSLRVASNEPLDGTGDGDTSPDWVVVDARRLQLRAERSGTGTGRVYTLTVTCGDASGNLAIRQLAVTVPKNQR